jgi:Holliday junction resolvase RusA-like endonuclease
MSFIQFSVPGEPRGKCRPRAVIRGAHAGVYTDSKTVAYESLIALAAKAAMQGREPYAGPVRLHLEIWMSVPASASRKRQAEMLADTVTPTKKPDACNVLAAAQDGMNGIVYADDKQVVSLVVHKRYTREPRLEIQVSEIYPKPKADLLASLEAVE